ncbi:hypothetical protein Q2T42_01395 [Leptolyngbya boryana CZ1]|uniref:Uncharacterized protein n=1 Tax=Leptolyngbya boryana CZ1 TaxID=3060204 RepID=A0AA96X6H6_LEPBY|nr:MULTISPECIES: hypothetical protein [Leptolyngbya]MBD1854498.1 hypothetical protein [Leptolyngbya sp. FACHB-1624]MBD2371590.1 hypothetical protein [Leptolyngbya sp. FACHB-161]MBD2378146.1 hypothetical protein [Leptolyngbya sp. FACHB-238]MBD2402550.1 hypothetical protein [Leptolyngbya sp. FACHB-239]MBD2409075.1 hypothetical protein [Leptolyngbya sp. FACHB-402]
MKLDVTETSFYEDKNRALWVYAIVPHPIRNWLLPLALPDRWLDRFFGKNLGLLPKQ